MLGRWCMGGDSGAVEDEWGDFSFEDAMVGEFSGSSSSGDASRTVKAVPRYGQEGPGKLSSPERSSLAREKAVHALPLPVQLCHPVAHAVPIAFHPGSSYLDGEESCSSLVWGDGEEGWSCCSTSLSVAGSMKTSVAEDLVAEEEEDEYGTHAQAASQQTRRLCMPAPNSSFLACTPPTRATNPLQMDPSFRAKQSLAHDEAHRMRVEVRKVEQAMADGQDGSGTEDEGEEGICATCATIVTPVAVMVDGQEHVS